MGSENSKYLEYWLFEKKIINEIVPLDLINNFYEKFQTGNQVIFSHPIKHVINPICMVRKILEKKINVAIYSGIIPAPNFIENLIKLIGDEKNKFIFVWKWKIFKV